MIGDFWEWQYVYCLDFCDNFISTLFKLYKQYIYALFYVSFIFQESYENFKINDLKMG